MKNILLILASNVSHFPRATYPLSLLEVARVRRGLGAP